METFKPVVVDFWQNSIQEEIAERDILGDFCDADDIASSEALALKQVNETLSEYGIAFDNWLMITEIMWSVEHARLMIY